MLRAKGSSVDVRFGILLTKLALVAFAAGSISRLNVAHAGDVTWTNGSSNSQWDTSSANWTTGAWNNANGDGAIFNATGAGAISVAQPINVNSMNFTVDGYSLTGPGSIAFVNGVSTQTTGVATVASESTAKIFVPLSSAVGFQKIGGGVLELNSPCSFTGAVPIDPRAVLTAGLLVGGVTGTIGGGTLRVMNSSVIPASTNVSIGTGYLDIGSNNQTLANLIFTNQNPSATWNTTLNANNGVVGSGTLRVIGEINVLGAFGDNAGNSIATPVDLGGGTQVIRIGGGSSFALNQALMFTGSLSNGSLLKTIGYNPNGVQAAHDGMSLFGNNTYTGSTVLNGGANVATGTNATSSIKIAGIGGPAGNQFSLQGANGSALGAGLIQAYAGGNFILDNNAAVGASGSNAPNIPAAQNNNRIRDDAEVQLRDGSLTYRGFATAAASEAFGNLTVQGGHNIVTITPNGAGGTATLTATGNLSIANRATLQVAGATLGAAGKVFVNGTLPAADATGILPRMVGSSDFLTYNGTTGLTPYTGYSVNTLTPGANVSLTAASTVASSVNINALKRGTSSFTTTIASGQTLGIDSGMILNAGGTGTFTGGTIDFGAAPGVLFAGTTVINSAVRGSSGLIHANGTATLAGDLSGLTGALDVNSGTMNLNTNTFAGPINVRNAFLNLNVSQTGSGLPPITLGVAQNDSNLTSFQPTLSISGAGANSTFSRDIVVDNGSTNAAGVTLRYNQVSALTPLSNTTGSQTLSGNITLNTSLRLQGGGASNTSTGSTNFTGNISGPGTFHVPNGRANFSGTVSNAGGFNLGDQGFSMKVTFSGTGAGTGPITISGGNTNTVSYTAGSLPGGPISVWNSSAATQPQIIPLNNSTINNQIILGIGPASGQEGNATANVGAGIVAEWAGPIAGFSPLTKTGTGRLVLSNMASTYTGAIAVNAGTLSVDGVLPASTVAVASSAIFGGTGVLDGDVTVTSGGSISPGNSVGTLTTGDLSVLGSLISEIDLDNGGASPIADLLKVNGTVSLSNATLALALSNLPAGYSPGTYLLVANDNADPVSGAFATISGLPIDWTATIDYAFSGVDALGRFGTGNDIAIMLVPEPVSVFLVGLAGAAMLSYRRRR